MRRRIVRIKRDRLFEAGHRLLATAEYGEHPAEIAMRLRPISRKVEGPAERRLGFGKAPETHQGVGMVDICSEKLRDQPDGPFGTCQARREFLLLVERGRKIV